MYTDTQNHNIKRKGKKNDSQIKSKNLNRNNDRKDAAMKKLDIKKRKRKRIIVHARSVVNRITNTVQALEQKNIDIINPIPSLPLQSNGKEQLTPLKNKEIHQECLFPYKKRTNNVNRVDSLNKEELSKSCAKKLSFDISIVEISSDPGNESIRK